MEDHSASTGAQNYKKTPHFFKGSNQAYFHHPQAGCIASMTYLRCYGEGKKNRNSCKGSRNTDTVAICYQVVSRVLLMWFMLR